MAFNYNPEHYRINVYLTEEGVSGTKFILPQDMVESLIEGLSIKMALAGRDPIQDPVDLMNFFSEGKLDYLVALSSDTGNLFTIPGIFLGKSLYELEPLEKAEV